MTRNVGPVLRSVGLAAAMAALLMLGGCGAVDEAFKGVNPVAKKLDESASQGEPRTEDLTKPPNYEQRPADAAADGRAGGSDGAAQAGKAPGEDGDSKRIDLKTGTGGETLESRTLETNRPGTQ